MRSVTFRVLVGMAVSFLLPVTALNAAPVGTAPACASTSSKLVNIYSFHIEAKPERKTYRRGEDVKIHVKVTRPAEEDPAGNRTPMPRPTSEAAADVTVGGAIYVGNTYRWDSNKVTDEEGKATLHIRMPKNSDTGWVRADFAAEKVHFTNNGCPDVREVGYRTYERFVNIKP